MVGFAACLLLGIPYLIFVVDVLEPAFRNANMSEALFLGSMLGMLFFKWGVIFRLLERNGKITFHGSYFELKVKNNTYNIKYKDVKQVYYWYVWYIDLKDGTKLNITPAFRIIMLKGRLSIPMYILKDKVDGRNPKNLKRKNKRAK